MQEKIVVDADGVQRRYGYDDFGGVLYLRDKQTEMKNPGRPYRPIYAAKQADLRGIAGVHAEMWSDPEVAKQAIATDSPTIGWRSAH